MDETVFVIGLATAFNSLCIGFLALTRPRREGPVHVEAHASKIGVCDGHKFTHRFRNEPQLIAGDEEVYYCIDGCGSTLRYRRGTAKQ